MTAVEIVFQCQYTPHTETGFDPDGERNCLEGHTDALALDGDRLADDIFYGRPPWRDQYRIVPTSPERTTP